MPTTTPPADRRTYTGQINRYRNKTSTSADNLSVISTRQLTQKRTHPTSFHPAQRMAGGVGRGQDASSASAVSCSVMAERTASPVASTTRTFAAGVPGPTVMNVTLG
jgi:hypothetical protein